MPDTPAAPAWCVPGARVMVHQRDWSPGTIDKVHTRWCTLVEQPRKRFMFRSGGHVENPGPDNWTPSTVLYAWDDPRAVAGRAAMVLRNRQHRVDVLIRKWKATGDIAHAVEARAVLLRATEGTP